MKTKKAFTLIEILIVVCILGIVAAIVAPHYSKSSTKAKEAAAKETLQTLRTQIELYTLQHKGLPPAYIDDTLHDGLQVIIQLVYCSDVEGKVNATKKPAGTHIYGPYLANMKVLNPFNDKISIKVVANMPEVPDGDSGWLYCPDKKDVRLNWPGKDTEGQLYYEY